MSKPDIIIEKIDESTMRCHCEDIGIHQHLYEFFQYEKPNFVRNKFSKSTWDGFVRLYNKRDGTIPSGLLQIVLKFAKEQRYTIEVDPRLKNVINAVERDELVKWVETLDLVVPGEDYHNDKSDVVEIDPYFYQYDAVEFALRFSKCAILAATGAGKSLIQYLLVRYLEGSRKDDEKRTLIVVPSAKLVDQMKSDFESYSIRNGWDANANVHQIVDGAVKFANKPVFVSTWQAIQDESPEYFEQFDSVIVDECHLSSADKITRIMKLAKYATMRVGLTGTLRNTELHSLQVQANFGPIKRVVSTKQLQDIGQACDTEVTMMNLQYSSFDKEFADKKLKGDYQKEIDWLIRHPWRNKLIKQMALTLKGNSLFLFNRNEAHLEVIYNELKELKGNVYMINGDVAIQDRAVIERLCEEGDNVTILASYGTMSTGVSIKKLHNLVLCHPSKSIIRVLQSLGRMLRRHSSKKQAKIYDIVDNLKNKEWSNTAMKHGMERYGFYTGEQHKVVMKQVSVGGTFLDWKMSKPKKKDK